MIIIPISHEDLKGRRWPYVTGAILLLNVLIFLTTHWSIQRQHGQFVRRLNIAFDYYVSHPYLEPKPPLDKFLTQIEGSSRKDRLTVESMKALHEDSVQARGGVKPATQARQQARLDKLCEAMAEAEKASPLTKYAYIPAENNALGLITSQFLHGGWMHLIFNMLFLWLAGCNIEDRWGRVVFPLFYLSAGVVAALAHKASAPQSFIPLIGASGAIAGAMGAFLMKFGRTRIKFFWFFWMFFFIRAGTFHAPAYLMLPLWLGSQLFYGLLTSGQGGGVAFWAHVGGFVYGVVFALALGVSGIEEKVNRGIEGQISLHQDPQIVKAGELIDAGQTAEAIGLLEQVGAKNPSSVDAQLELLRAAKAAEDQERARRAYVRLIGLYVKQNSLDTALNLYEEMSQAELETAVPAALRLRLAKHLEKSNFLEGAAQEYCNIYSNSAADNTSFQALLAHANLMLRMGRKAEALQLFTVAQNSPLPHLEWEVTIAHGVKQAQALSDAEAQSSGTPGA